MTETSSAGQPSIPFSCPRCGFEQSAAMECSRCGIVFAKLRPDPPVRSGSALPVERQTRGSFAGWLVMAALAGAAVILLLPRSQPPEPEPAASRENLAPATASALASEEVPTSPPPQSSPPQSPPPAFRLPEAPSTPAPSPEPPPVETKLARLPYTWYEGSQGYRLAMQEAAETGLPVAVYFYTDWCPYCRQLDSEILRKPPALAYFAHVVKVRINPENGPEEQAISDRYGVSGYPSFFVQPSPAAGAVKIQGQRLEAGRWRARAPEDFIASCQAATTG